MKPTVGRIVHYKATNRDEQPITAIIDSVNGDSVNLNIMKGGTISFVRNVTQAENFETAQAGQWCWPERVAA